LKAFGTLLAPNSGLTPILTPTGCAIMQPRANKRAALDLRTDSRRRHATPKFESPLPQTFCTPPNFEFKPGSFGLVVQQPVQQQGESECFAGSCASPRRWAVWWASTYLEQEVADRELVTEHNRIDRFIECVGVGATNVTRSQLVSVGCGGPSVGSAEETVLAVLHPTRAHGPMPGAPMPCFDGR
jgi:hypothetical protein